MNYLLFAIYIFGLFYILWIFYLAVMNLKRVRDLGLMSKTAKVLGYPVLLVGYALDIFLNVTVMTLILFELPKETTISSRLKRHNRESTGWRKSVARWFEPLLDPYDPSGDHI
jgi:uncharacterized membrane protein YhaH (DUF805 family)